MIEYSTLKPITAEQFIAVLKASGLSERRPVDDAECIRKMVENADLTVGAWDGEKLVGVARSVTDFSYCCYVSDLAVDLGYQKHGIGKKLLELTREQLGPKCMLLLLAAPASNEYYPRIGMAAHSHAYILKAGDEFA